MKILQKGFTLLELMIVIAIISILASIGLPSYVGMVNTAKIKSALKIPKHLQVDIEKYYQTIHQFPLNNEQAGLPPANKLIGPEVTAVDVENGAFHVTLGNQINKQLKGKQISVRPVYVKGYPKSPIAWVCGHAPIPKGMSVSGKNLTNLPNEVLPIQCRDLGLN